MQNQTVKSKRSFITICRPDKPITIAKNQHRSVNELSHISAELTCGSFLLSIFFCLSSTSSIYIFIQEASRSDSYTIYN